MSELTIDSTLNIQAQIDAALKAQKKKLKKIHKEEIEELKHAHKKTIKQLKKKYENEKEDTIKEAKEYIEQL